MNVNLEKEIARKMVVNSMPTGERKVPWKYGMKLGGSVWNANGNVSPDNLGFRYTIQTVTELATSVVDQIFYRVAPADFFDVVVGFGAWMENIKINTAFQLFGSPFNGLASLSGNNAQMMMVDAATSPVSVAIDSWSAGFTYSVIEINKALASLNWDVVESRTKALKTAWDILVQQMAFLGNPQDQTDFPGFLTNPNIAVESPSWFGSFISQMNASQFQGFVANIIGDYFAATNYTRMPNKFVIPYSDWNGLQTLVPGTVGTYPVSMFSYLLEAFKNATQNPDFKILPLAYCDAANNEAEIGTNRYVLYNDDPDTVRMYIPVQFLLNPAASANNVQWQAAAIGQLSAPVIIRPAEVRYYDVAS